MITFTNASKPKYGNPEEAQSSFDPAMAINHFNTFVLGKGMLRMPGQVATKITAITSELVTVEEKSPIGESTMTYRGTPEEMVVLVVLAAQKFLADNLETAQVLLAKLTTPSVSVQGSMITR